jgi:hypothetical protein
MAPTRAMALLVPCALAFAGCGGGGGGSSMSSTVAPLTSGAPASLSSATPGTTSAALPLVQALPGTSLGMDFTRAGGFYDGPFPCESLRRADGTIDATRFPNPTNKAFVVQMLRLVARDVRGFGTTSGAFFHADGPLDPARLPSLATTVTRGSPVFLIGVDPAAPDHLRRYPVQVRFELDGGPHGAANLLSIVPLQGIPLREDTAYAVVVLRALGDAAGHDLGVPATVAQLGNGVAPPGLSTAALDEYRRAIVALRADGVDLQQVAGLAVFRTDHPTRAFDVVSRDALARPLPRPITPFHLRATFPTYYVVESTIRLPDYQHGQAPYLLDGGGWQLDPSGRPVLASEEEANVLLTIPRGPMPRAGFPAVVLVRAGFGNGPQGIVDRGRHPAVGAPAAPGSGPASEFAAVGFAGVQVDGPHGGRRNVSGLDEQLLMFNPANPEAMRDNVRQSALELVVLAEALDGFTVDPAVCPGVTTPGGAPITIDTGTLALFGHSMGATIAPLVLAQQPRYRAAILSGSGGSWIENVMYKASPVAVRGAAELLLGYGSIPRRLEEHDPVLSLLQWAGEPADPPVYARYVTREPRAGAVRHVLMFQGVADTYIPPPVANATSLSLGLDLAGTELDATHPLTRQYTPLRDLLGLSGGVQRSLPASGNRGAFTAVLVQHPEDGLEDGHEVAFQQDAPKREYREFLRTYAQGLVPVVPQ